MRKIRIFLASSNELEADRRAFELWVGRRNKQWIDRGQFLHLEIWEDFSETMSRTRLQAEYNRAITGCELFVVLYWSKLGPYTCEEFEAAFGSFEKTAKPFVLTYFKTAPPPTTQSDADRASLEAFRQRLKSKGHFESTYRDENELLLKFGPQLERIADAGFETFEFEAPAAARPVYQATAGPNSAIAQGKGAKAVTGVLIEGDLKIGTGDFVAGNKTVVNPPRRRR